MRTDVTRPRLHFTAQAGWINDPLGISFHGGRFHLFFQFVPGQTVWVPEQSWGHATSEDLLHWTEGEVALAPGEGDDGVWSGSIAVPDRGPSALFYTTVKAATSQIGKVRLARPVDENWTSWVKKDVVVELPEEIDAIAFRDPYLLHDGACWRMLVGAGLTNGTAAALSYRSEDLESWIYDGLFATRHKSETEPVWTGAIWECPQFFRLSDRWVLAVSVWDPVTPRYEAYAIGDLVEGRFVAETWGRLSYGPSFYAGSAFTDADGACGLIHWLRGVADPAGRWVGAHSLPHRLHLEGGCVVARPHPAVAAARTGGPTTIRDGAADLPWVVDLEWTLDELESTATVTVASDGEEQVRLHATARNLLVRVGERSWDMPIFGRHLRVVLDGPVMEIFASAGVMAAPVASTGETRTVLASGAGTVLGYALN